MTVPRYICRFLTVRSIGIVVAISVCPRGSECSKGRRLASQVCWKGSREESTAGHPLRARCPGCGCAMGALSAAADATTNRPEQAGSDQDDCRRLGNRRRRDLEAAGVVPPTETVHRPKIEPCRARRHDELLNAE